MSGYYSIEAAAMISGLSIKAIRYWMRKDLLRPIVKGVDEEIGYFDENALKRMKRIKTLHTNGCHVHQIIVMLG